MKVRKRNNLIIGILCAILVFMGVGYAILSTTLNITAQSNIKGSFDIHFLNDDPNKKGITLIDYAASETAGNTVYNTSVVDKAAEMESYTEVNAQDPTYATFTALFKQPNDYATFTATVKNYGTIKGQISRVTIEEEPTQVLIDWLESKGLTEDDWDQFFSISNTAEVGTTIDPGETNEFTVTVRYLNAAEDIPEGEVNFTITVQYQQPSDGSSSGGNESQILTNDAWRVDNNGKVISYNSESLSNGVLTIPATADDGRNIVSVDSASFSASYTVEGYVNDSTGMVFAVAIRDTENYETLAAATRKFVTNDTNFQIVTNPADIVIPDGVNVSKAYLAPDISMGIENMTFADYVISAVPTITTLDLRSATNLTTIGTGAFFSNQISEIKFNNVLTSIGIGAFYKNKLTTLSIPSSVVSIEKEAFEGNNMTTLDLSNATNLTSIGIYAFGNNSITSLTIPSSVTTIEAGAFYDNSITSLIIPSSVTTIGDGAFRFNALTNLDLSGATSLTTIGELAFYQNRIQTLTLPASIMSISRNAFASQNYDASNPNTPLAQMQLMTINVPMSKSTFESRISGYDWYSDGASRNGFRIIYTDYTCDYEGTTCTIN